MNPDLSRIIAALSTKEKADIWSTLNRSEWPEILGAFQPNMLDLKVSQKLAWDIQRHILTDIGIKECLRSWNKKEMNDEQFERWYETAQEKPRMHNN